MGLFLIALVAWSVSYLYIGLLKGSEGGELRRTAVAAAEEVYIHWREKAQDTWIETADPSTEAYSSAGSYMTYLYQVDVSNRLENPLYDSAVSSSPTHLSMRMLTVTLEYKDENQTKQVTIHGSVAR